MKNRNFIVSICLVMISISLLPACQKAASEKDYGASRIFMPQAIFKSGGINNDYPVPSGTDSSTYNYKIDAAQGKINIILGTNLSGSATGAYSVDVTVNNDTIQKMLTSGSYDPSLYVPIPTSMYTLPNRLDVPQGARGATFNLSIDIPKIKQAIYEGKKLILAVKVTNPTNYEMAEALSTTIVIIDVNALVIGPKENVTYLYIKNAGNPFIASGFQSGSSRWGSLKDWKANAAARSHGGFGGYTSDGGGSMNMESGWGSPQILNGKIYQTVTLPAGTYTFDHAGGNWTGGENFMKGIGYAVVAPGIDSLPDYNNIVGNSAISYVEFAKPVQPIITFKLTTQSIVTLGVVVNYSLDEQGFKSKQVLLYNYPKHL